MKFNKNLIIILFTVLFINYSYGAISISSIIGCPYGFGTVSIVGTGFIAGATTTVSIANLPCPNAKSVNSTLCTCSFSEKLSPATGSFNLTLVNNGQTTSVTKLFNYMVPSISDKYYTGTTLTVTFLNLPDLTTVTKVQISDSLHSENVSVVAGTGSISCKIPQTIAGGLISITAFEQYGFTIMPVSINLYAYIKSMNPKVFDLTGTSVTIVGLFFGKTANVNVGGHIFSGLATQPSSDGSSCSVTFTTRTEYEDTNVVNVTTATGGLTNTIGDGTTTAPPQLFTYSQPTIVSAAQNGNSITITTNNTGTNINQIKLTIGSTNVEISTFTNQVITSNALPSALPEGKTAFNVKAGNQAEISTSLLLKPILNTVTQAPYNGGNVTISGFFLNNAHVYYLKGEVQVEIICSPNENGESIVCPVSEGNGTIEFTVSNYQSYSTDQDTKESANIVCTYTETPIETPSPTPTETPSEKPVTPAPTQKPEVVPSETPTPSGSFKLPNSFIFSLLIVFISFILLI